MSAPGTHNGPVARIPMVAMECPLCHTDLSETAVSCTKCDWVRSAEDTHDHVRDIAAVWLSLIPGLGHLYKGHILVGGLVFFLISPLLLGLVLAITPATLGLSLLILPAFMAGVMFHAYQAEDIRARVIRTAQEMNKG
jgi:hypothetical protein